MATLVLVITGVAAGAVVTGAAHPWAHTSQELLGCSSQE